MLHNIRRTMGRRLSGIALAVAAVAAMTACSSGADGAEGASCKPADGPVELTYWTNGVEGMDKVVEQWNEKNPDIQVKVETFDDYPTLTNALAAGEAPDIAQIEYSRITNFRAQDAFVDASSCLEELKPDAADDFIDWTWAQATGNGDGVYGIPQDVGPMAMYYNKALFDQFGIAVPATWEEYREAAKKFREHDMYISHFDPTSAGVFNAFMWQNHSQMYAYTDAGWQVMVDNPQSQQVADFWQGMVDDDLVRTDLTNFSTPLSQAFANKDLAVNLSAAWSYTGIPENQAGDWRVAALPNWDASSPSSANWGGSVVAFMKGTEHPYEALEFLLWLNDDPDAVAQTFELGGLFPASLDGQNMDALQQGLDNYGGQKIFSTFFDSASLVDPNFVWGPTQDTVDQALTDGLSAAVGGNGTFADALSGAQQEAVDTMKAQGLTVAD